MINDTHFDIFPNLKGTRLLLRKLTLADAPYVQLIRSDERVMTYMDSDKHLTLKHSQKFISENLKLYEQKKGIFWAIVERASGKFIGDFAYWKIDAKNSRAEIGYTLKPEYWGMGYMKEAMVKIISFGYSDLQLHSIEANINPENKNSRGILMKLGFRKEAYFRENYFFNGKFLDSEIYSLLETDFRQKNPFQL